ncbi:hypothetical protein FA13DRAFT_1714410 [Coprinellus micaceus]|uniref:Uncharacterized protein n=1 Tax=Coprinellus micaceus TaxID=71717 RepID=A0A4Y7SSB7_COPMI|nr:hypothetical protein FA13DRAFT_1714410 [Coprinellus micaceus]
MPDQPRQAPRSRPTDVYTSGSTLNTPSSVDYFLALMKRLPQDLRQQLRKKPHALILVTPHAQGQIVDGTVGTNKGRTVPVDPEWSLVVFSDCIVVASQTGFEYYMALFVVAGAVLGALGFWALSTSTGGRREEQENENRSLVWRKKGQSIRCLRAYENGALTYLHPTFPLVSTGHGSGSVGVFGENGGNESSSTIRDSWAKMGGGVTIGCRALSLGGQSHDHMELWAVLIRFVLRRASVARRTRKRSLGGQSGGSQESGSGGYLFSGIAVFHSQNAQAPQAILSPYWGRWEAALHVDQAKAVNHSNRALTSAGNLVRGLEIPKSSRPERVAVIADKAKRLMQRTNAQDSGVIGASSIELVYVVSQDDHERNYTHEYVAPREDLGDNCPGELIEARMKAAPRPVIHLCIDARYPSDKIYASGAYQSNRWTVTEREDERNPALSL